MNDSVAQVVLQLASKFSHGEAQAIDPATRLVDLKMESLDMLEFQMHIDEAFAVELPLDRLSHSSTLRDVMDLVSKSLSVK